MGVGVVSASAAFNVTTITDAMDMIWAILGNINDNISVIISIIVSFAILALISWIAKDWLRGLLQTAMKR